MQTQKNIDIFVHIVDNFWDLWFVLEYIFYFQKNFPWQHKFFLYTNEKEMLSQIFAINNIAEGVKIFDVEQWRKTGDMAISFFHSPFPKGKYRLSLRIDYISFDKKWLENNFSQHIFSTPDFLIIEMIPSVQEGGSGLLPKIAITKNRQYFAKKFDFVDEWKKWCACFCYGDTFEKIDFSRVNDNVQIFIFGGSRFSRAKIENQKNIFFMPFLDLQDFYAFFELSDFVITRGEVSFSQILQMQKPFFWDIYHEIGGFPEEQANDFLAFIDASEDWKQMQKSLWYGEVIHFDEVINVLKKENKEHFQKKYKNFCEETLVLINNFFEK